MRAETNLCPMFCCFSKMNSTRTCPASLLLHIELWICLRQSVRIRHGYCPLVAALCRCTQSSVFRVATICVWSIIGINRDVAKSRTPSLHTDWGDRYFSFPKEKGDWKPQSWKDVEIVWTFLVDPRRLCGYIYIQKSIYTYTYIHTYIHTYIKINLGSPCPWVWQHQQLQSSVFQALPWRW